MSTCTTTSSTLARTIISEAAIRLGWASARSVLGQPWADPVGRATYLWALESLEGRGGAFLAALDRGEYTLPVTSAQLVKFSGRLADDLASAVLAICSQADEPTEDGERLARIVVALAR